MPINTVGSHFSNFAAAPVELDGVAYPTVEHAYQAAKTTPANRTRFLDGGHLGFPPLKYGLHAKRLAKSLNLRPLPRDRKLAVMESLLRQKFCDSSLAEALRDTFQEDIQEVAPWDSFWGTGPDGLGENHLGELLMRIRDDINEFVRRHGTYPAKPGDL